MSCSRDNRQKNLLVTVLFCFVFFPHVPLEALYVRTNSNAVIIHLQHPASSPSSRLPPYFHLLCCYSPSLTILCRTALPFYQQSGFRGCSTWLGERLQGEVLSSWGLQVFSAHLKTYTIIWDIQVIHHTQEFSTILSSKMFVGYSLWEDWEHQSWAKLI